MGADLVGTAGKQSHPQQGKAVGKGQGLIPGLDPGAVRLLLR